MAVFAKKQEKKEFVNYLPAGNYPAYIYAVVDIGVQETENFNTKKKELQNQVAILFELDERFPNIEDVPEMFRGKRFVIEKCIKNLLWRDNKTGWKSGLIKMIKTIAEREFTDEELEHADEIDIASILVGKYCNVETNEKGYFKGYSGKIKNQPSFKTEVSKDYIPYYTQKKIDNQIKQDDPSKKTLQEMKNEKPIPNSPDIEQEFYDNTGFDDRPVNPNMIGIDWDEPGY